MATEQDFAPEPQSVRDVRRFVAETVPYVDHLDDILLVASEMATNVVKHARTDFQVRIDITGDVVRVDVSNGSSILPALEDLSEEHRGLLIIDTVSKRWGVESTGTGKIAWAEFDLTSPVEAIGAR